MQQSMKEIEGSNYADLADSELVSLSVARQEPAFEEIVRRYQKLVCSVLFSRTLDSSLSQDLGQETFICAWRSIGNLESGEKLKDWLIGISHNLLRNHYRKNGERVSRQAVGMEETDDLQTTEPLGLEMASKAEESQLLRALLQLLPETYREPLILYYWADQSTSEVADQLDLSEEGVRQRLSRGRQLLKEKMLAQLEAGLRCTKPGTAFTMVVMGGVTSVALPASAAVGTSAGYSGISGAPLKASSIMQVVVPMGLVVGSYLLFRRIFSFGFKKANPIQKIRSLGYSITVSYILAGIGFLFWFKYTEQGPGWFWRLWGIFGTLMLSMFLDVYYTFFLYIRKNKEAINQFAQEVNLGKKK